MSVTTTMRFNTIFNEHVCESPLFSHVINNSLWRRLLAAMLFPPLNFGVIEEDLYRSAMPTELNFPFMRTLQLRTILNLSPADEMDQRL
jgi:protein tyrosine/serine phosphatase